MLEGYLDWVCSYIGVSLIPCILFIIVIILICRKG